MADIRKLIAFSVIVFVGLTAGCADKGPEGSDKSSGSDQSSSKSPSEKAADFTLTDHLGEEVSLSDYSGKIVVLEWLNYDCPFVKPHYEAGTFVKLARKYADQDVVWLGINTTHYATQQANREWAQKHDLPYKILDDSGGAVGRMYAATRTPEIFIIGKSGEVLYHGAIDNAPRGEVSGEYINYADKALASITAGREVEISETEPYGCTVKYAE